MGSLELALKRGPISYGEFGRLYQRVLDLEVEVNMLKAQMRVLNSD